MALLRILFVLDSIISTALLTIVKEKDSERPFYCSFPTKYMIAYCTTKTIKTSKSKEKSRTPGPLFY